MRCARAGAGALSLLLALAAGCRGRAAAETGAELAVLGTVPEFALTDQTGAPFRAADLAGRVHVVNFIFTRCPTVCPVSSRKMARLAERLEHAGAIRFVSFSVDPEHDTPAVLAAYAARYRADPARWKFLTGPPAAVRTAAEQGFKIAVERGEALADGTPSITHGTHFILVDRHLRIRGYYDSDDPGRLDQLARDAEALAGES